MWQFSAGVLTGSLLAALIAAAILRIRNRTYRRLELEKEQDEVLSAK